jgi:hypothetical protein
MGLREAMKNATLQEEDLTPAGNREPIDGVT